MKLIVYTNLESYEHEGLLQALGLSMDCIDESPIKGIRGDLTNNHLPDLATAREYDILLCHQFEARVDNILERVDLEEDWAIVLHTSSGKALRNLYSRLAKISKKKILYRYEHSSWGKTFDFLKACQPSKANAADFDTKFQAYLAEFEVDAFSTFKHDLVQDIHLWNGKEMLANWTNQAPVPYLWQFLFQNYSGLSNLMNDYFNAYDIDQKKLMYLEILKMLK